MAAAGEVWQILAVTWEQMLEYAGDFRRLERACEVRAEDWKAEGQDPGFLLKVAAVCRHEADRLAREAAPPGAPRR